MFKFIILSILIFANISYANGKKYFIQLGSFKQLTLLEKTINSMPQSLRSHIVIVNSNSWFIPFAYHTKNRQALVKRLPYYRRYFRDAYINSSPYIRQHAIVRNYTTTRSQERVTNIPLYQNVAISQEDIGVINIVPTVQETIKTKTITPIVQESKIPKPKKIKIVHKKYRYFTKKMISGKHYYLAYKATKESPNLLIKVKFGNHIVTYQPVIGEMQLRDARYIIDDKKLYMFADKFSKEGAFSKIDAHTKDYILVSSWAEGKKLNTLRYYYRLNDAKKYLGAKGSKDPLAKALEESEIEGVYLPNF